MYNDIRNNVIDEVIEALGKHHFSANNITDEVIEFLYSMKKIDPLKAQVITIARELLDAQEEEIESGIEDRIYSRKDNEETLAEIKLNREVLDTFEKSFL